MGTGRDRGTGHGHRRPACWQAGVLVAGRGAVTGAPAPPASPGRRPTRSVVAGRSRRGPPARPRARRAAPAPGGSRDRRRTARSRATPRRAAACPARRSRCGCRPERRPTGSAATGSAGTGTPRGCWCGARAGCRACGSPPPPSPTSRGARSSPPGARASSSTPTAGSRGSTCSSCAPGPAGRRTCPTWSAHRRPGAGSRWCCRSPPGRPTTTGAATRSTTALRVTAAAGR